MVNGKSVNNNKNDLSPEDCLLDALQQRLVSTKTLVVRQLHWRRNYGKDNAFKHCILQDGGGVRRDVCEDHEFCE